MDVRQADLGALSPKTEEGELPACDIVICANVSISPDACTRGTIFNLMRSAVRPGGSVLVVPSVASALNIRDQHKRWVKERRRRGYERDPSVEAPEDTNDADERRGIFQRDGVRTKHFRRDVQAMLSQHGSASSSRSKGNTLGFEFESPTRFLDRDAKIKRPFDWLVVAVRDTLSTEQQWVALQPMGAHPQRQAHMGSSSALRTATVRTALARRAPSLSQYRLRATTPFGAAVQSISDDLLAESRARIWAPGLRSGQQTLL